MEKIERAKPWMKSQNPFFGTGVCHEGRPVTRATSAPRWLSRIVTHTSRRHTNIEFNKAGAVFLLHIIDIAWFYVV